MASTEDQVWIRDFFLAKNIFKKLIFILKIGSQIPFLSLSKKMLALEGSKERKKKSNNDMVCFKCILLAKANKWAF